MNRAGNGRWLWLAFFVLAALFPLLKPSGYLLDIGVNIMIYAMLAYGMVKGHQLDREKDAVKRSAMERALQYMALDPNKPIST